jgi:hypothetical protein
MFSLVRYGPLWPRSQRGRSRARVLDIHRHISWRLQRLRPTHRARRARPGCRRAWIRRSGRCWDRRYHDRVRSAARARSAAWACFLSLLSLLALAACDGASRPSPRSSHPASLSPGPGSASAASLPAMTSTCPPTAQLDNSGNLPERQGVGHGATLWALFFPTTPVLTAGQEIKVVWRITGNGDFSIDATGPGGKVVKPVWGPKLHSGSTWSRPGDEWGTGWVFPAAGCWTINAKRTSGSGYLVLRVGRAAGR